MKLKDLESYINQQLSFNIQHDLIHMTCDTITEILAAKLPSYYSMSYCRHEGILACRLLVVCHIKLRYKKIDPIQAQRLDVSPHKLVLTRVEITDINTKYYNPESILS